MKEGENHSRSHGGRTEDVVEQGRGRTGRAFSRAISWRKSGRELGSTRGPSALPPSNQMTNE
jgi:hypothetical protein